MSTSSIQSTLQAPNMEFALGEDEQSVVDLAAQIFAHLSDDERHVASVESGEAFDTILWEQIVEAGLLEALLPVAEDEPGMGMVGLALIAREQGRYLGRIPLVTTAVAALALAEFGGHQEVLENINEGTARVGVLLPEVRQRINGQASTDGWVLNGTLEFGYVVPGSTHLLVQFHCEGAELVALIEADRVGVDVDEFTGISNLQHAALSFDNVRVSGEDLIGAQRPAGEVVGWIRPRLLTAAAALTAGACEEAVRRTAAYTSEREQFGRPLSTNQGVAMRAADAHIDSVVTWLTTIDAAWQLDNAGEGELAAFTASWCAREGGFRAVHATQHLHGGMGADLDNHIHRFFVWVRELDVLWGSAGQVAEELAEVILPREGS
ncbi:acyl-CoA dehydrogenase [Paeniglutamicibacter gangotriensis]|uniref:Acyl-CoA dehydrogenase n=1 Tax=Paeniglutamicibacter gangotriensis TaxID=254787 RepID=A0A5B0E3K5_9MICC|nr:acyl-CoA dehydrogenase family protein [Paeniglutamicibacter gangotriensis]KAA0972755.1 acyl-CoA dehydrogenase [Paeniglutamicibacter gangotriensis]